MPAGRWPGGPHLSRDLIQSNPIDRTSLGVPCYCYYVRFLTHFPRGNGFQDVTLEPVGGGWKVMGSLATPAPG